MENLDNTDQENLKHIFRTSNVYGKYLSDISPQTMFEIGQAFGTYLIEETELRDNPVYIAYDFYKTSQILVKTLTAGILSTGINVKFSGSPVLLGVAMFSSLKEKNYASAYITASPPTSEWVGVRFFHKDGLNFSPEQYKEIRDIFVRGTFVQSDYSKVGQSENICLKNEYKDYLRTKFVFNNPIKVVVDCYNDSSYNASQILEDVGLDVERLFTSPKTSWEPEQHSFHPLSQKVRLEKANFGISFNGDADQVFIVDNNGEIQLTDKIGLLIADHYLNKKETQKRRILASVDSTLVLEKVLAQKEVTIDRIHSGPASLTLNAIENQDTLLGIDRKGCMVFPDLFNFQDAIPIPLKLAQILSEDHRTLAEIVDSLPQTHLHQSIIPCENSIKFNVIDELIRECRSRSYNLNTTDGIRIKFGKESCVLIRASITKPEIKLTVEADSQGEVERLLTDYNLQLSDLIKNMTKFRSGRN